MHKHVTNTFVRYGLKIVDWHVPIVRARMLAPGGNTITVPNSTVIGAKDALVTFYDLTNTTLSHSKLKLRHWILATFLLCLSCSSRRIARELGVHGPTSYRWCWFLRNAALSYEVHRQLEGTIEADEIYHTASNKGQAKDGGKKRLGRLPRRRGKKREPGRGHYDKDRPAIIAWVSRTGDTVVQAVKEFSSEQRI